MGAIFAISDFDEAEELVLWGTADEGMNQLFASINIPVHTYFAMIFFVSFVVLLCLAYRNRKSLDPHMEES